MSAVTRCTEDGRILEIELDGSGARLRIHVAVNFTCPFCGHARKVAVGFDASETEAYAVHDAPHCEPFERLEIAPFMKAARLAGAVPIGCGAPS